jgi:hypothetical protein
MGLHYRAEHAAAQEVDMRTCTEVEIWLRVRSPNRCNLGICTSLSVYPTLAPILYPFSNSCKLTGPAVSSYQVYFVIDYGVVSIRQSKVKYLFAALDR